LAYAIAEAAVVAATVLVVAGAGVRVTVPEVKAVALAGVQAEVPGEVTVKVKG
jgi:hypothetical protein